MKPGPSPRAVAPKPTYLDRGLPPRMAAPKQGLDETMDLLSRVLGADDEDLTRMIGRTPTGPFRREVS